MTGGKASVFWSRKRKDEEEFWEDVRGFMEASLTGLLSRNLHKRDFSLAGGAKEIPVVMPAEEAAGRAMEYALIAAHVYKMSKRKMTQPKPKNLATPEEVKEMAESSSTQEKKPEAK